MTYIIIQKDGLFCQTLLPFREDIVDLIIMKEGRIHKIHAKQA